MSSRDWRLRIQDILRAVEAVQERTAGMSFEEFEENDTILKAVLYDFIVIGEASHNVPQEIQAQNPDLPWRLMKDMRNVMAHEYFQLDLVIVWRTIQKSLPQLVAPLKRILEQEGIA